MDTPRELLLQMLAEQSFHLGEFKLSSGGSSDYYFDFRATTLSGEGARHVGFKVVGVLCLVEREEAGGRANIEKAAPDAPFVSLFTADQVREEHLRMRKHEDDPLLSLKREVGGE